MLQSKGIQINCQTAPTEPLNPTPIPPLWITYKKTYETVDDIIAYSFCNEL